ncbi:MULTISPECIES: 1,4-alpha-glucan branching protein GlgB [unclassified Vibrio]|uniref:1,4-alpha-glucan branching enzyme GlgB n=1 Tax=Vibrio sp. HB236076 TaxID=3232307 RepID=A0AB39HLD5_9VIBR|nr:1,4-alpha-glucan branching protein GlgB [Vibrio sp. HB161653]MDP5252606.1 1,4-alpha-glucan branching protein GlgB [Vibrio sp. HB161653]
MHCHPRHTKQVIAQLSAANFADPFSFLGPYQSDKNVALRVWSPEAERVFLSLGDERFALVGDQGVFTLESSLDLTDQYYTLLAQKGDQEWLIEDPYQFHDIYCAFETLHQADKMAQALGSHCVTLQRGEASISGVRFLVYAPHASSVSVIGEFNHWDGRLCPMQKLDYGVWGIFIPNLPEGTRYKFEIKGPDGTGLPHKADPWGYYAEQYPSFASVVYDHSQYQWQDTAWQNRQHKPLHQQPISIYEVHLGSWKRHENGQVLTYRELAEQLIPYVVSLGYTHIELMPISEYPFDGSWGYQPVGLFAPTSRYGKPDDFKFFVDQCHQAGIGVILDWVPAHFPADGHGLANFDGTPLFHDPDPRRGWHPDWNSFIYDLGKEHVRRFLLANVLFWLDKYHIDGIRVDAVASMLYLDYSREDGQWIANQDGGNQNYDAINFFRWVNEQVYLHFPKAMTIAEESTAFPGVTAPTEYGGLGFGFKWNMGWMHDSLNYIQKEPIYRQYHHHDITFPLIYAHSENYVLSLSHDEVVHGKRALLDKMPGDEWQKTANLRAYLAYMYGQPGKKLNFMGYELGQTAEWNHDDQLQWFLLQFDRHQGIQRLVSELNDVYKNTPALYQNDRESQGFEWRKQDDSQASIIAHERIGLDGQRVLIITNFTPVPHDQYCLGVPKAGRYQLLLNSDNAVYGGSDYSVLSEVTTKVSAQDGQAQSLCLRLPPLATVFYRYLD